MWKNQGVPLLVYDIPFKNNVSVKNWKQGTLDGTLEHVGFISVQIYNLLKKRGLI